MAEQDALYAQGRTTPGSIVTNARGTSYSSQHQWGIAADFYIDMDVDGDGVNSDDAFNNATRLFDKVGSLAKSISLGWGGDWKSTVDKPHLYLPDWGSTTSKLKSQYGTPEAFIRMWQIDNAQIAASTQNPSGYAHRVGETVTYSTCYAASTDPNEKAINCNPWKVGKITKIKEGAKNPYLIENGRCWVNDGDIRSGGSDSTVIQTTQTPQTVAAAYVAGQVYTLQAEMKVRTGAGTNYRAKTHNELTSGGKVFDGDKDGALDKGTRVTCQEMKKVGSDIWVRIPSGWVAAVYGGKVYIK